MRLFVPSYIGVSSSHLLRPLKKDRTAPETAKKNESEQDEYYFGFAKSQTQSQIQSQNDNSLFDHTHVAHTGIGIINPSEYRNSSRNISTVQQNNTVMQPKDGVLFDVDDQTYQKRFAQSRVFTFIVLIITQGTS
jgi:hypothetical protein